MTPNSETELAEIIKAATKPLKIVGGGTRQALGNPVDGVVLNTSGLNGITLYEPDALTIVVKAGTPLTDIETALDQENQQLSFEPMCHKAILNSTGNATIGGIVACNISGPRRIQAGACRDSMLGVRGVDGMGNIFKNGGRVMKNVTGYDLVKLMTGSFGTLGVISEVSLKVLPKPETKATIIIHGLDVKSGITALSRSLGSPNDVTGAAHVDAADGPITLIRIEGFEKSVAYRVEALKNLFKDYDITVEIDLAENSNLWRMVKNVELFANRSGDLWKISTLPTEAPNIVPQLRDCGVDADAMYDWGGGLIWLHVAKDTKLRAALKGLRGYVSLVRGDCENAFHPQSKAIAQIEAGLRSKFDLKSILNTGVMG